MNISGRTLLSSAFIALILLSVCAVYYRYIILQDFEYETKDIGEFTEEDL